LRGLLAALVVADHALTELGSKALGMAADIAVAIFFGISGLVLTRAWGAPFGIFLIRRFIRLWPVFALCLAAGGLLAGQWPVLLEFIWLPIPRYDGVTLCPPMWSLFLEAWAALAMPAIVWSARGGALRTLASMAACVTLAAVWHPSNLSLRAATSYLVCFVAGAGLSRTEPRGTLLESPPAQWLGRISYSLYLTHWLVLHAAARWGGAPGTIVGIPLAFGVAWGVWRLVEWPSIVLSRKVESSFLKKRTKKPL
jgi:peptidoglycan/LPS O-acetylase OafA/YrhL